MTDPTYDIRNKANQLRDLARSARVELFNSDHSIRVVVGPSNTVLDIEVTSRAAKYSASEVGPLVVELLREADQQMKVELNEKLAEVLGADAVTSGSSPFNGMPTATEIRREIARMKGAE